MQIVAQPYSCLDNYMCCHTETEVADQTCYFIHSQYADSRPTSAITDLWWQALARQPQLYQLLGHSTMKSSNSHFPISHSKQFPISHGKQFPISNSKQFPINHGKQFPFGCGRQFLFCCSKQFPLCCGKKLQIYHGKQFPVSHSKQSPVCSG